MSTEMLGLLWIMGVCALLLAIGGIAMVVEGRHRRRGGYWFSPEERGD